MFGDEQLQDREPESLHTRIQLLEYLCSNDNMCSP
jgi:hypothetical protein